MLNYSISEIEKIIGYKVYYSAENNHLIHIKEVCFDTRKSIYEPNSTLFLAIETANSDGHNYLETAHEKGIRVFLATNIQKVDKFINEVKDCTVFLVNDVITSLHKLAKHFLESHKPKNVVVITGSNGKTVVKEWLSEYLKKLELKVYASPNSYNSKLGVPISILEMKPCEVGIFEVGVSEYGEMEAMAELLSCADIGIFTHLGDAHDSGFISRAQKAKEKIKLFKNSKKLIFQSVYPEIIDAISSTNLSSSSECMGWSFSAENLLYQKFNIIKEEVQSKYEISFYENSELLKKIAIHQPDAASQENIINVWLTANLLSEKATYYSIEELNLKPVRARLELKKAIYQSYLISDYVNHNLSGLQNAIDYLTKQIEISNQSSLDNILIVSDFETSPKEDPELYKKLDSLLNSSFIENVYYIGAVLEDSLKTNSKIQYFKDTQSLITFFSNNTDLISKKRILLKGQTKYHFEQIEYFFVNQKHATQLEINLTKLKNNLQVYAQYASPAKLIVVVKAAGYGNGAIEIAQACLHQQVDYFAVAYVDEAVELAKEGLYPNQGIIVFNIDETGFEDIINHKLQPVLYNLRITNQFINFLKVRGIKHYPIHLKLDTGMNRLGFKSEDLNQLIQNFIKYDFGSFITIESVFSHLAAAGEPEHKEFTIKQFEEFNKLLKILKSNGIDYKNSHITNTDALHNIPKAYWEQYSHVRLGLGLYGINSNENKSTQVVLSLSAKLIQIKKVDIGETVGYSRKGIVEEEGFIGVVSIGYADGLTRLSGNGAFAVINNNHKFFTIGNICMDVCMIFIPLSHKNWVYEGMEVEIISERNPIQYFAEVNQIIPYQILTAISQRVKRVFIEE